MSALARKGSKSAKIDFVPYPVLSVQSVEGARVELALRELGTPQQFFDFHPQSSTPAVASSMAIARCSGSAEIASTGAISSRSPTRSASRTR